MNSKIKIVSRWIMAAVMVTLLQGAVISMSYAAPPAGGQDGGGGDRCDTYHQVQPGETLFSIGRRYGVNAHHLAQVNGLRNPNRIYTGQILHIPCSDSYTPPTDRPRPPMSGHKPKPAPQVGYGYDFTGYYYETYYPNYQRYSYTCGYHYNCY